MISVSYGLLKVQRFYRRDNMRKLLIISILGIFLLSAMVNVAIGEDKTIDTVDFYVETDDQMVNATSATIPIEDGYNDTAHLMVYNNATYNDIRMKVTAGPSPDGDYLSEVYVDLGNNERYEYYFGGAGTGNWGNQSIIKDKDFNDKTSISMVPADPSDNVMYVKIPSNAVVSSTNISVESTGVENMEVRMSDSMSGITYANSYFYRYRNYYRGYYRYDDSYLTRNVDPKPSYYYSSGYSHDRGYIKWDTTDPSLQLPPGIDIMGASLKIPTRIAPYRGYYGTSRYQNYGAHIGERTYGIYQLTESIPYYSGSTKYTYSYSQYYSWDPSFVSTPEGTYTVPYQKYSSGSTGYRTYYVDLDITDLYGGWVDGSITNYGVMIQMASTSWDTAPHDNYGNSYYNYPYGQNYYRYFRSGYMYSPEYSTSSYRPVVVISYPDPTMNHTVDIGNDGNIEKSYPGAFTGGEVYYLTGLENSFNIYLRTHYPDEVDKYGNEFTYVPIQFDASSGKDIMISDVEILYDYTADVYYNPETDIALNELVSLVPYKKEDGVTYIPINVTATGEGNITFLDLSLEGIKPNYRPTVDTIPEVEVDEGVVDDEVLAISDYFHDMEENSEDLTYILQMNDQEEHIDVFLAKKPSREGKVYLGVDATKDDNWYGTANIKVSATDNGGKAVWSDLFQVTLLPVNDHPYVVIELPLLEIDEGIDTIAKEYNGPQGRDVATGKMTFLISEEAQPYFADVEENKIHLDFMLEGEDVDLVLEDEYGFRIFQNEDASLKMTVLPPEYTDDDPNNYLIIIGSGSDFQSEVGDYTMVVYASDDISALHDQTNVSMPIIINEFNDEPMIFAIPDILMDEDTAYTSMLTGGFIETYVYDVDTPYEDLIIEFSPADQAVRVSLNEEGDLLIELEADFNGVVPVVMTVVDDGNIVSKTFKVRIRSINDAPTVTVLNLYDSMIVDDLIFIRGTASDIEKELRSVEVALAPLGQDVNEEDWQESNGAYVWQFLLDIRDYEKGDYTVHIRSYDGRDYSEEAVYDIYIDTMISQYVISSPVIKITTLLTGDQSGKITIEGTATDDIFVELVEYRVDGSIWKPATKKGDDWSILIDTNKLSNAYHNFSVRAYDGKTFSEITFMKFKVMNVDSDLDGIPNEIEEILLMDPFNPIDGRMDFDGDGFTNVEEYKAQTDPFDPLQHPDDGSVDELMDPMVLAFIFTAIICTILIIGLFVVNVNIDRNIQRWKEDLNIRRTERKPKTLLQKMVEIAPTFVGQMVPQDMSTALPSGQTQENMAAALPPAQEGQPPQ